MDSIGRITAAELPALHQLIRDLRRFERLEHEVEAPVESLHDSIFGPRPVAGALLAYAGEQLAGYALYFFTFSSFTGKPGIWLDDLYVRPAFRHQGHGRAFMEPVARIGVDRDCRGFEWAALNCNSNALEFYRKLVERAMDHCVRLLLNC